MGHEIIDRRRSGSDGLTRKIEEAIGQSEALLIVDNNAEILPSATDFRDILKKKPETTIWRSAFSASPPTIAIQGKHLPADHVRAILDVWETASEEDWDKLFASLDLQSASLGRRWNTEAIAGRANASLFRHTEKTRKFYQSERGLTSLSTKMPVFSVSELEQRLDFYLLEEHRRELASRLHGRRSIEQTVKDEILLLADSMGKTLPYLPKDDSNAWLWRYTYLRGRLERPTIEVVSKLARTAQYAIDGGAHIGYLTSTISDASLNRCKVIAIEPHAPNAAALMKNVAGKNVVVEQAALSSVSGHATFHQGSGHSNGRLDQSEEDGGETVQVRTVTLDELAENHDFPRVDLLKLDIEGFEPEAIAGAKSILKRSPDCCIVMEINPRILLERNKPLKELVWQMKSLGLYGRKICDNFSLGPVGHIAKEETANYLFARVNTWPSVINKLTSN